MFIRFIFEEKNRVQLLFFVKKKLAIVNYFKF